MDFNSFVSNAPFDAINFFISLSFTKTDALVLLVLVEF